MQRKRRSQGRNNSLLLNSLLERHLPYFQTGAEPPPREEWDVAKPIDFRDVDGVLHLSHQLDAAFRSVKEIETPLGMDDTQQLWKWADVGSCQMPRSPPMYPALLVGEGGARQPAAR